uniref:Conotoxin Fi5a n=1 Tax=Conus figulinus TaxID=101301 RepID=CM5A_CONFI|nr:RecName: Full=Conotoxin Fi5a [Conus figulinus]
DCCWPGRPDCCAP